MTRTATNMQGNAGLAAHIARYHIVRRQFDDARALLSAANKHSPTEDKERRILGEAFAALASAYLGRKDLERAAEAIASARTLAETPDVWKSAAAVAQAQGVLADAEALWQRVTAAEPEQAASWLALGRVREAAGDTAGAVDAYLRSAQADPSHATILSLADRLAALAPAAGDTPAERRVRIAIIGSSTLDHVRGYLEVSCLLAGLVPTFYLGPFDQYAQDILDPSSPLYSFEPDVVIAAIHGRALFPDLYDRPFDLDEENRRAAAMAVVDRGSGLLAQLTARTTALVLWHTFATPQYSPLGAYDLRDNFGQTALFATINGAIAERVRRDYPSVHLVDEDRIYGRIGKRNVTDPRMWHLARIGIGEGALGALAGEYMRFIKAYKSRARKCLVLDLDNTLWGGVVGEDGPSGILLGQEAPGNAYRAFQEAILSLSKRGIILAINSKNNETDAMEVLERHPEMVLRPSHFAALRINWLDKAANLESIAAELNIGLDSMVFVDDNPAECALVRSRLPEVLTVALPRDPAYYRQTLLDLTDFDTLALTEEDRSRSQLYAQRRERQQWEAKHSDNLHDYLAELDMVVEADEADEFDLPRVAQLIGKTNQFNLTTRRHNEAAVRAFAASRDHIVYSVRVKDRFGDHGLVGTAIVVREDDTWTIDTLLLSCRVLGRGVETAFLSAIVAQAREDGTRLLRGLFIPTPKNAPARDFYGQHGFSATKGHEESQEWTLNVQTGEIATPPWLTLRAGQVAV